MKFALFVGTMASAVPFFASAGPAVPSGINTILPWASTNRTVIGMTRAGFVASRPKAVQVFTPDVPLPPDKPFNGVYMESDFAMSDAKIDFSKVGDIWFYTFKGDRLRAVCWARKNDATEADAISIRQQLITAYGTPIKYSVARSTSVGKKERITKERYFTVKEGGYAVDFGATNQDGIEVCIKSVSDPESRLDQHQAGFFDPTKSVLNENDGKRTIVDILARIARRDERATPRPE